MVNIRQSVCTQMILCLGVKILGVDYVIDIFNKEYTKANVYEEDNIDYLVMIFNFYTNGTYLNESNGWRSCG